MYNGPALPILSVNRLRRLPDDPYCPLGDIGHVSQQRELSPNSPNLPSLEASFLANNVAAENVFAHTALERKPGHGGKWSMKRNHLSSPAELMPLLCHLDKLCLKGLSQDFERKKKFNMFTI